MNICKNRAFELLKKISFERVAGTEKELECAHILEEECKKADVPVTIEEFDINMPEIFETRLEVTAPDFHSIPCIGIGKSGQTPDEGITAPLYYVENGTDANLMDAKDKIILFTGDFNPDMREKLEKSGAAGFILTFGSLFDPEEMIPELRTKNLLRIPDDHTNFPGVVIHITEAQKLLRMHPTELHMVVKQDADRMVKSHNVVATMEGSEKPEEIIVFSAHYDSVIYSTGAWDNGTGSMTIMELMHHFKANPPKRTLKFIWCGGEEFGLLGSRAYCDMHKEELEHYLFDINVDMTGTLLGYERACCSCDESFAKYLEFFAKIEGFPIEVSTDLYSSDSSAFVNSYVPAMTIGRGGCKGGAEIHSRRDTLEPLDADAFIRTVEFMVKFADPLVNAKVFPIPREIPKDLLEKLTMYRKLMGVKTDNEDGAK